LRLLSSPLLNTLRLGNAVCTDWLPHFRDGRGGGAGRDGGEGGGDNDDALSDDLDVSGTVASEKKAADLDEDDDPSTGGEEGQVRNEGEEGGVEESEEYGGVSDTASIRRVEDARTLSDGDGGEDCVVVDLTGKRNEGGSS
jgi:hypothetical protein